MDELPLAELVAAVRFDRNAAAAAILVTCECLARLDRRKLKIPIDSIEDVASVSAFRVLRRIERARSLPTSATVGGWCRGFVARVALESGRDEARAHGAGPTPDPDRRAALADRLGRLSDEQLSWIGGRERRVVDAILEGRREREIARAEGVSSSTVHRIGERVAYRMFGRFCAPRPLPLHDAEWATAVLALAGSRLAPTQRHVLELRASGSSLSEIASATGVARGAVWQRLVRLGRRFPRTLHGARDTE